MAHVIALANHKGGASKTTTTANLGAAFAMAPLRKRVLLIDADPQSNLSTIFGCEPELSGLRVEDLLERPSWEAAPPAWISRPVPDAETIHLAGGVHLVPCTDDLEVVVAEQSRVDGFAFRLKNLVTLYRDQYDYILIDTPPGRQQLATMALLCADFVIAPIRPADFDVEGALRLTEMLEQEIAQHNPRVKMLGVLITQADRRWKIGASARASLTQQGIHIIPREVPFAVRVGQAPRYLAPTIVLEPDGRVGSAYRDIAILLDAGFAEAQDDLRAAA
jgi:chromosome partitioning protein